MEEKDYLSSLLVIRKYLGTLEKFIITTNFSHATLFTSRFLASSSKINPSQNAPKSQVVVEVKTVAKSKFVTSFVENIK